MGEMTTAGPGPQRWTEETMFVPGSGGGIGIRRFTKKFRAAIAKETHWEQMEDQPALDWEEGQAVGLGDRECPLCGGVGLREVYVKHRGQATGIEMPRRVGCYCRAVRRYWDTYSVVGERFYHCRLDALQPSTKVTTAPKRQAEIIKMLRDHPGDSHLLIGPPGGGKTHLMAALFSCAAWESAVEQTQAWDLTPAVWWASTSVLLNQHVARETDADAPEPYVTERAIRRAVQHGWRPRLFLDEIDKIAVSDFKIRRLGEVVNAVYALGGQVVGTMNKTADQLAAKWKDEDEAATILRRIGSDGGHTVYVG